MISDNTKSLIKRHSSELSDQIPHTESFNLKDPLLPAIEEIETEKSGSQQPEESSEDDEVELTKRQV